MANHTKLKVRVQLQKWQVTVHLIQYAVYKHWEMVAQARVRKEI